MIEYVLHADNAELVETSLTITILFLSARGLPCFYQTRICTAHNNERRYCAQLGNRSFNVWKVTWKKVELDERIMTSSIQQVCALLLWWMVMLWTEAVEEMGIKRSLICMITLRKNSFQCPKKAILRLNQQIGLASSRCLPYMSCQSLLSFDSTPPLFALSWSKVYSPLYSSLFGFLCFCATTCLYFVCLRVHVR